MEGGGLFPAEGSTDDALSENGWEGLLQAQSDYIANLQRMLQSACQEPTPSSSGSVLGLGSAVVGSQTLQLIGVLGPEQKHGSGNFQSTAWSPGASSRGVPPAAAPLSPPSAPYPQLQVELQHPSDRKSVV